MNNLEFIKNLTDKEIETFIKDRHLNTFDDNHIFRIIASKVLNKNINETTIVDYMQIFPYVAEELLNRYMSMNSQYLNIAKLHVDICKEYDKIIKLMK